MNDDELMILAETERHRKFARTMYKFSLTVAALNTLVTVLLLVDVFN